MSIKTKINEIRALQKEHLKIIEDHLNSIENNLGLKTMIVEEKEDFDKQLENINEDILDVPKPPKTGFKLLKRSEKK